MYVYFLETRIGCAILARAFLMLVDDIEDILFRRCLAEGSDVIARHFHETLSRFETSPARVRTQPNVLQFPQLAIGRRWLGGGHVETRAGDNTLFQTGDEFPFVTDRTSTGVDEEGGGFHLRDLLPSKGSSGLGVERCVQTHIIRLRQHGVHIVGAFHVRMSVEDVIRWQTAPSAGNLDVHPQREGDLGDLGADSTCTTNQSDGLAIDFVQR